MPLSPLSRTSLEVSRSESIDFGYDDPIRLVHAAGGRPDTIRLDVPDDAAPNDVAARYRRIVRSLVLADVACVVAALLLSYVFRFGLAPLPLEWVLLTLTAPIVWTAVFRGFGLYSPQHTSGWEEFRNVISASSVGIVVIAIASFWTSWSVSRVWLGLTWLLALLLELLVRKAFLGRIASLKASGALSFRTAIVGTNLEAGALAETFRDLSLGFRPVGYVAVGSSKPEANGIAVLGHIDRLDEVVSRHRVDCLFVASTAVQCDDMRRVAEVSRRAGLEVKVSANVPEMLTSRLRIQPVGDVMSLAVKPVTLTGGQAAAKRAFDLVLSTLLLVAAAPVMALAAIAIKLDSPGPALFRQERVTKSGRRFSIYKFRTMRQDAERLLGHRVDTDPFFKLREDPRVTRVGALLRKFSIDELPQVFNVLAGQMSLVGPRPLPVAQVQANLELLEARHEVPGGVTGWWQVQGRSDLAPEEAARLDSFYIENWSLSLDLYILLKTFGAVFSRAGAY